MCSTYSETNTHLKAYKFPIALKFAVLLGFLVSCSIPVTSYGQHAAASTTPQLHYDFPYQMMWDDAVLTSVNSGKPVVVFDLDLIDSNSIKLAREVIESKELQAYLDSKFEVAMNDFAVDPPMSVGLDSLRNLGWRLSGLEKNYMIGVRPCIIVIGPNKEEINRIVFPQKLSASELHSRIADIVADRNTLHSAIVTFWGDTTSVANREHLITMLQERGKYDSVVYHLDVLRRDKTHSEIARTAFVRYADLRLQAEGMMEPMNSLMASLGKHGLDSSLHYDLLQRVLEHYKSRKMVDSVAATYDRILKFANERDPDVVNEYAYYLSTFSTKYEKALTLVNEALRKKPEDPNFYDTRAVVYAHLKKLDAAIRDEEHALKNAQGEDAKYFQEQLTMYRNVKASADAAASSK